MSQSSVIVTSILAAFLFFIIARGEFQLYVELFI